jgi:uncharacterized membrane protein
LTVEIGPRLLFLIVALVLFVVAAVGYNPPRGSLIAAGLAFFAAAFIFG